MSIRSKKNVLLALMLVIFLLLYLHLQETKIKNLPSFNPQSPANIRSVSQISRVIELSHCEIFFAEELGGFEEQINLRIKAAQLIQSNILLSNTTQNIGYYALICY